jgi:CubicO group peptidase (beta-lactamase class C family)
MSVFSRYRRALQLPGLLTALLLSASFCLPASAIDNSGLEKAASALAQSGFQGAVLAARGDQVLLQKSMGQFGELNQTFRFASVTKQMTAILVMQEVDAGKLKLDASLGSYWPDYPNADARAITLRQLLTHYSGLYNENAIPDFHMTSAARGDNMQEFATGVCAQPLKASPGSSFDYNNCDYMVLGALLERMNKQSFAQLLKKRIFQPAGMKQSGLYNAAMPDNRSHVHGILNGQPEPEVNFASYGAAGSSFGTLQDLLAMNRAFIQGKLMSAAARSEMLKPNATGGALGVWVYPFGGADAAKPTVIVERQGWIAGIRILNLVDVASGNVLILVSTNGDLDLTQTWANQGPAAALLSALIKAK